MNNYPDIIRWSQLKRFLKHTFVWMTIYGVGGWLLDITKFSEQSTTSHLMMLVGLSIFMAFLTIQKN